MDKQNKVLDFNGQKFFVGIDVHNKSWKVTIRHKQMTLKTFSMNPSPDELYKHLDKNYPGGTYLSVYESGFCGYWIHRKLTELGMKNIVVNPADVPTTNKEKDQKRDQIDSRKLACQLEGGSLKSIYIPSERQQALRSVSRLYIQTVGDRTRIKMRIKSFLHFNGIDILPNDQIANWSGRFILWLNKIEFEEKENRYHLDQLILALHQKRKQTLEILKYVRKTFKDCKTITYLKSISGIGFITAFTLYAELMDIRRFKNNDQLASYIGLIPSVYGTSDKETIKGLTTRHNKYLRKRLIEAAWVAVRVDPAFTQSFDSLTKRMVKQKAIIRIAKKLLNRIRYVWINEKMYQTGVVN